MTRAWPLLASLLLVGLAGCLSTEPPDNVPFRNVTALAELDGVYRNLGVGEAGEPPLYLSRVIWPKAEALHHDAVATVEVEAQDDRTLLVRAVGDDGVVVKAATFIRSKDFEFESGRVVLHDQSQFVGGDPVLGPDFESTELGIDGRGDGKYSNHSLFVGLLVVFPLVLDGTTEVRFVKLGGLPDDRRVAPARN